MNMCVLLSTIDNFTRKHRGNLEKFLMCSINFSNWDFLRSPLRSSRTWVLEVLIWFLASHFPRSSIDDTCENLPDTQAWQRSEMLEYSWAFSNWCRQLRNSVNILIKWTLSFFLSFFLYLFNTVPLRSLKCRSHRLNRSNRGLVEVSNSSSRL